MRREILVPKLGLTMSEGVLVEWMVQPGESFNVDQGLFVIESEKAANEVCAESDGVLLEIIAQVGETLPCGTVIGYWDDGRTGEGVSKPTTLATAQIAPVPAPPSALPVVDKAQVAQRVPVTPLARRVAAQQGVDLTAVTGSGPRGRIRAKDVLAQVSASGVADTPTVTAVGPGEGALSAPTVLERTIAQRLTAAKQQVPHFYLAVEAEMSAVISLRAQLNAAQTRQRLTLNHFVLAAVGQALEAMPEVNRVWTDEGILRLNRSDVGMAVNTEKGLWVPVLRGVGLLSLGDVAKQSGEMIARAQASRLSSGDMQGGAITVSNAGMHDDVHDIHYQSGAIDDPGCGMYSRGVPA